MSDEIEHEASIFDQPSSRGKVSLLRALTVTSAPDQVDDQTSQAGGASDVRAGSAGKGTLGHAWHCGGAGILDEGAAS